MKRILFTGARSGIAKATIDKLKLQNYKIYVTVRTESQLKAVKKIYENDANIECFMLDITNKEHREMVNNIDIDILVCNAAVNYGGSLTEMNIDLIRETYEVNVFSNLEIIQLVLKNMVSKKQGKIVIISSLAGLYPIRFLGSYSSSKASLIKIAQTLKKELYMINNNIKVCLIEPGFYYTGFNQVMFENKYSSMDIDSYFKDDIEKLKKREKLIHYFVEKKKLDSIVKKLLLAIKSDSSRFLYRAPFSQVLFVKLYSLFKE